jgi:hypothetical protein
MQIAEVKDGEAIEGGRQPRRSHLVLTHAKALGIAAAAPIETARLEGDADQRVNRIPILDVKEIDAAAKDARLVITFDAEPLSRMRTAKAPLQLKEDIVVHAHAAAELRPMRNEHETGRARRSRWAPATA